MEMKNINEELKRFWAINRYAEKYIIEQEAPIPAQPAGMAPPPPAGGDISNLSPEGSMDVPEMTGDTETPPEVATGAEAESDDTTEEIDITDLVNMTKSIKKQLDDQPKAEIGVIDKMDNIFNKLGELEVKLGEMDNVIARIDQLSNEIEKSRPKTPVEKLELRSLDSYPFSQNPSEFFNDKQQEMRASGKNEYILTKGDVENYGKYEIMKSFNPKAVENDYNF